MLTAQSRYAMFLTIVALLLGGLAPVSTSAQTGDEPAFVDSMDGQSAALLLEESPDPSLFVYRYALGQYTLQALSPQHSGDMISYIQAGPFGDSRTAVDAAIDLGAGGERSDQYLIVGCRAGDDNNGYAFRLMPATGGVSIWRLDADGAAELATGDASGAINAAGELNRIEIECVGDAISGIVNGQVAVSATDGTHVSGTSYIGAGTPAEFAGTIFAVFDNLEIFDLTGAQAEELPAEEEAVEEEPVDEEPVDEEPAEEESAEAPSGAVDPAALEAAVIDYAITVGPVVGPFAEEVMLTNGALRVLPAGVDVSDFHTEVRFVVPVDALPGTWSVGFCFWVDIEGNCYDVYIASDGSTATWNYARFTASGESELIESGPITGLDLTPGISNFIGLSVVGDTGILIVNSPEPAASFTLESTGGSGDIVRWLAFEAADPADTRSFFMSSDEFSVWDLSGMPPVAGQPAEPSEESPEAEETEEPAAPAEPEEAEQPATPESEEVNATGEETEAAEATPIAEEAEATEVAEPEEEEEPEPTATEDEATPAAAESEEESEAADGDNPFGVTLGESVAGPFSDVLIESDEAIEPFLAGVDIADFYVRVDVVVPPEAAEPWDFTIGFRDFGLNDQYRFTIVSDGTWTLAYGDEDPFDSGEVDNLRLVPGEVNTIELVAELDGGEVALNGERFTSIFLTEVLDAGDIWIATAANFATTSVGRVTEFRDFQVFEIE